MSQKNRSTSKINQTVPKKPPQVSHSGAGSSENASRKKPETTAIGTSPEKCTCGSCLDCSPIISCSSFPPKGNSEETLRENLAKELKELGVMYPVQGPELMAMGFSKDPPLSLTTAVYEAQDPKTPSKKDKTEPVKTEDNHPPESSHSKDDQGKTQRSGNSLHKRVKITELLEQNVYGEKSTPDKLLQDIIDAGNLKNSVLFYQAHQSQIPFPMWVKFLNRTSQKPYDTQDFYLLGQLDGFMDGLHQSDHQTITSYKTTFDTVLNDIQILLSRNQSSLATSDDQRKKMALALDQSNKNSTLILQAVHKVEGVVASIPCSLPSSLGLSNKTPDPAVSSFQLLNAGKTLRVTFDGKAVSCKINPIAPNASELRALGKLLGTTPLHLAPQLQLLGIDKIINTYDSSYSSVEELLKAASED